MDLPAGGINEKKNISILSSLSLKHLNKFINNFFIGTVQTLHDTTLKTLILKISCFNSLKQYKDRKVSE